MPTPLGARGTCAGALYRWPQRRHAKSRNFSGVGLAHGTSPKFFLIPAITKAWGARYSGRAFLWVKQNADLKRTRDG